jgi:autoinducer 2 (AI-2) kinase
LIDVGSGTASRAVRPWRHSVAPATGGLGVDLDLVSIWRELGAAARECVERAGADPADVASVAVTSMRDTTVVLDGGGSVLLAAPNRDARAVGEASDLAARRGDWLYDRTGHWPSPVASAARLRWLAAHHPDAWARAAHVLSLSDWIALQLCGEIASDPSQCAETLLFDIRKRAWSSELAAEAGVSEKLLPPVLAAGERLGALGAEAAALLGLRTGCAVAVGGADTHCGVLAAGAMQPGDAAVVAGSSVPVAMLHDRPLVDAERRLWSGCHLVPGLWLIESNAGLMGEALEWLAGVLFPDSRRPLVRLLAEAETGGAAAGAWSTFGTSLMNAREMTLPTGALSLSHLALSRGPRGRGELARAVVAGIACAVRANLEQAEAVCGTRADLLRLAGGMARGDLFVRLLAAVAGRPVSVHEDATALGAAICGGVAAGVFVDLAAGVAALGRSAATVAPGDDELSADYFESWCRLRDSQAPARAAAAERILPGLLERAEKAVATPAAKERRRPRILVTADFDPGALAALGEIGDVEAASFRSAMRLLSGDALVDALAGFEVFVTEVDVVDAAALARLPDLRAVVSCRGDAVNVDAEACTAYGIPVLNAPGRNADAVAELTVAFLLALARKLPAASAFLRQPGIEAGDMGRMGQAFAQLQGRELWHKTIGLVGCGAVGAGVARRLAPFGARVLVHDPHLPAARIAQLDAEAVTLEELLERSDFVSLHAAVTDETRHLIDAAALRRVRPGCFLINTARAALVDEAALLAALREGHLGGAALDVFAVEPPGSDHPLLALDNVIATPHVAGNTTDIAAHQGRIVGDDLRLLVAGRRPRHLINAEVWAGFDWDAPRPTPDAATRARLAERAAPAVTDLERNRAAEETAAPAAPVEAPAEMIERMRAIIEGFIAGFAADPAATAAAAGNDVTLHFTLKDLGLDFYLRLRDGQASGGLGTPPPPGGADVELRMRAAVFDGMFTGAVDPMQEAMSGGLSFRGDTTKAMTLQSLQGGLSRVYQEVRAEVGDPGDLASLGSAAGTTAAVALAPGDVREELLRVVHELYEAELITATGGNVSVRVDGSDDQIWITPSRMFKGDLRPEILVRVDLDGTPLDEDALSPSSETVMHCAIYRARPDVRAVVHAHAPHATILANTGLDLLPISTEAAFFSDIGRVPFIMPGTRELADAVVEAMGGGWAVLMRNHGIVGGGRNLRRAADMVEIIERSCEVILACEAAGRPTSTLPDDVVATLRKIGDVVA